MGKVQSKEDLLKLRESCRQLLHVRVQGERIEDLTQITVFMGNSGYKSGAKEIMNHIFEKIQELGKEDIVLLQADSSGLVAFEPLVGVKRPGSDQVLFGKVDLKKADEILQDYIIDGNSIDGILALTNS
ncbi:MAG: hypothetical protein PHT21_05340 [Lachnospiraceae bacterium]|nr:hypothetical protein [Lachnospiraceae bacterium]